MVSQTRWVICYVRTWRYSTTPWENAAEIQEHSSCCANRSYSSRLRVPLDQRKFCTIIVNVYHELHWRQQVSPQHPILFLELLKPRRIILAQGSCYSWLATETETCHLSMCNYTPIHTSTQATIPACIWDMSLMRNLDYPTLDCKSF